MTNQTDRATVEPSAHPNYATEHERLEALSRICEEGRAVEKIINEAIKRNPNAFLFKE